MANSAQERVYKKTNEVKFGLVSGPGKGREYNLGAGDYWARRGGKFVAINVRGNATAIASSNYAVFGWAEVETKDSAATYPAILTSKGDRAYVIYANEDNMFEMPVIQADASLGASVVGRGCGITYSGTGYGKVQKAIPFGSSAASPLIIVDYNVRNKTVIVRRRTSPPVVA